MSLEPAIHLTYGRQSQGSLRGSWLTGLATSASSGCHAGPCLIVENEQDIQCQFLAFHTHEHTRVLTVGTHTHTHKLNNKGVTCFTETPRTSQVLHELVVVEAFVTPSGLLGEKKNTGSSLCQQHHEQCQAVWWLGASFSSPGAGGQSKGCCSHLPPWHLLTSNRFALFL